VSPKPIEKQVTTPWWVWDTIQDETNLRVHWITGGLGSGKSHGGQIWDIKRCLQNGVQMSEPKPSISWTVAPNYRICETLLNLTLQVALDVFQMREGKHFWLRRSFPRQIDFTPMKLNHRLYFLSADNPEHFVSDSITHWRWSEVGVSKALVYEKLQDRLRDRRAKILQGLGDGTPEGSDNHYAELANIPGEGRVRFDTERNFSRYIIETGDNSHNLAPGYVEALRDRYRYDPIKLMSYEKGLFVRFDKGSAYWEFVESRNVEQSDVKPSPSLKINLTFDFNVSPLAAVVIQEFMAQRNFLAPREKKMIALWESSGESRGLMDVVAEFGAAFPIGQYRHTPIEVYGDASGWARNIHSSGSDYAMIEQYLRALGYQNVTVLAAKSNPMVKHRLEKTAALMAYERFSVLPSCRKLISSFVKTSLKEGTFEIEKPTGETWTHFADGCTYAMYQLAKDIDVTSPHARKVFGAGV
jgi:hypothetical protein